jgi:predicted ArsR family transcriptional regulator
MTHRDILSVENISSKKKQSTREVILYAIRLAHQATVEDLAEAADVSPVTVRHHLNALQAGGLIEASSVRRKVGRPYYVYSISERGQELFPKRYVRLTSRLLDELKDRLPEAAVTEIFRGVVNRILDEHRGEYEHLPFEERLNYLVTLLANEGFLSSWEKTSDGYRFVEHSCPYLSVGNHHTEVCTFDRELILNVLQTPIQQHTCMLDGQSRCEFTFAYVAREG